MRLLRFLKFMKGIPNRLAIAAAPILRFLAALLLLAAVISLVADLTKTGGAISTAAHWKAMSPSSYTEAAAAVTQRFGSWVWDPLMTTVLSFPAYILFGALAIMLGIAGRRRRVVNIYIN